MDSVPANPLVLLFCMMITLFYSLVVAGNG